MPQYDIHSLKIKQEKDKNRKESLLENFKLSRTGFIELLEKFSEDAEKEELEDFEPLRKKADTNDHIEYSFKFNSMDLLIISTDEVYHSEPIKGFFAAKLFVFKSEEYEAKPLISITFTEHDDEINLGSMKWFTTEGPKDILGSRLLEKGNLIKEGADFAEAFLGHISMFENLWREKPLLGKLREKMTSKSNIGFDTSDQ